MMKNGRHLWYAVPVVITSLAIGSPALAQEATADPSQHASSAQPFATGAIDDTALQAIAGREDTHQQSSAKQTAGVADNSVGDNVRTGDARIDGNAFQNLSGLSVLNVNTGNNVAINAAMNVNIAINPAP
jgi:hypothetical protein